jgi:hypothetical protein
MARQAVIFIVSVAALLLAASLFRESPMVAAQEPKAESPVAPPLFEHEPYDRLTLNDKERTVVRLLPLPPSEHVLPAVRKPTDVLRVRLFDKPEEFYEVAWSDVAELRWFEQLLLDEAARLTREGQFSEAFEYFLFLRREYPKTAGLEDDEIALLIAEVKAALAAERLEEAQVRLVRLIQRNNRLPELADLAAQTTERLLQRDLQQPRPAAARPLVARFRAVFPQHPLLAKFQALLNAAAQEKFAAAERAFAQESFVAAQHAAEAAAMLSADPAPALALLRRAIEAYPAVVVGVVETVPQASDVQIAPTTSWTAARIARLDTLPVLDPIVTASAPLSVTYGGTGRWQADDRAADAFRLQITGTVGATTAADIAAAITAAAAPSGPSARADAASLGIELNVVDPTLLELHIARPHPRFEALVADILRASPASPADARTPYLVDTSTQQERRYLRNQTITAGPTEIIERRFADEESAYAALLNGTIDVVDRLAPWQVAAAASRKELRLARYGATGVHLLRFNGERPLLRRPEFRRAVQYAIDREAILRNHLRPARDDLASRLNEGLFAIGRSADDPLGYAYDLTATPQRYEPQRAYLLAAMARAADPQDDLGTPSRPLCLRHPPTATAAVACRRIAQYLAEIGIFVEPQPAMPNLSPDENAIDDLTYVVVSSTEPLVDAQSFLQPAGLVNLESLALQTTLRRLAAAETFAQARTALFELQRILHEEALIVPLWQLSEFAAARSRLTLGPANRAPTGLYQFVDQWRLEPTYNEPLP